MPEQLDQPSMARRLGPSPWTWMILACVIVAASGLIRVNQERLFADAARAAERSPFSIRDLPQELGGHWKMIGDEHDLPPETQQIAGCSDYLYRDYADSRTGVTLRVLVSFGPAIKVFPHSPIVCFPAHGYKSRGGPWKRVITINSSDPEKTANFSALVYGRSAGGGAEELTEVYYSYWHDGRWDPDATATKNQFQHRPAMFKIQVERTIIPSEINAPSSPIEEFVAALVPEIERRLDEATSGTQLSD